MKKRIIALLAAALILSLTEGCDIKLFDSHDQEPRPGSAVIRETSGEVMSAKADGSPNNPADKGVILWTDYTLNTGADSWAKIELGEGRYLLAEANTCVKVLSLPDGAANKLTSVEVSGGKVWVSIERELAYGEDFIIRTEGCAMSARGTVFSVDVDEGDTGLTVYDGTVNMRAQNSDGTAIPDADGGEANYNITNGSWAMTVENGVVSDQYGGILDEEAIAPLNLGDSGGLNGAIQSLAPNLLWSSSGSGGGDSPVFTLYPGRVEMSPGAAVPLYAAPSGGVTWSSSHPDVASVDSKGTVTAGVEGDAIITATRGPQSVYCRVVVIEGSPTLLYVSDLDGGGGSGGSGGGGTGTGGDDGDTPPGGGEDAPGDSDSQSEPANPNDIPVEWIPELDIPIEEIPKQKGYNWTIRISETISQMVTLPDPPPMEVKITVKFSANKNGGQNCHGVYENTSCDIKFKAAEDYSGEVVFNLGLDMQAQSKGFDLHIMPYYYSGHPRNNVENWEERFNEMRQKNNQGYNDPGALADLMSGCGKALMTVNASGGGSVQVDKNTYSSYFGEDSTGAIAIVYIFNDGSAQVFLMMGKLSPGPFNGWIYRTPVY